MSLTLANWDVTKSNASIAVAIANGRLRIDNDATKNTVAKNIVHLRKSSDFARGHLLGLCQTKMEVTDQFLSTAFEGFYGIMAMWSQADLTGGAGSAYAFGIHFDNAPTWTLLKFTGLGVGNPSVSAESTKLEDGDTTLSPGVDINYTLSLQWAYHALIGGTNLVCKVGLASDDFDNMTTIYDHTDSASPLTTSVGEGLVYNDAETTNSSDLKRLFFDDTSIIPLTGIPT